MRTLYSKGMRIMNYKGDELYWIAICDDEKESVEEIVDILMEGELEPGEFKISVFSSGEELLNANVSRYDLLILDIMFPGENGRAIAEKYRRRNKDGLFVFCTGKASPIPDDFKYQPYRYMRKDHANRLRTDLLDTVEEMYRRRSKHQVRLSVGKIQLLVNIEDIVYMEIAKNGCHVHYYNNEEELCTVKAKEKIKSLYPQLFSYGFEFAHNSYLVNCRYLKWWGYHELELINGVKISIIRAREKAFKEACIKYIV